MPGQPHVVLGQPQRVALGHGDLLGHQVEPGDGLGDRMLDLDPRVHLQEVKSIVLGVDQELDRAQPAIVQIFSVRDSRGADLRPQSAGQPRRGGFLDELAEPPLHRTVPVAEVDDAAAVAEQLDLDVAPGLHIALQVHPPVTERRARLGDRALDHVVELRGVRGGPQAPAATAADGLDQHRPADLPRQVRGIGWAADRSARDHRQAGRLRVVSRRELVADRLELLRRRPDEHQARFGARPGQPRVLGQEPVAGVDRVRARGQRGGDHGGDVEVTGRGRGRADPDHRVGQPGRQRVTVGVGDREHGLDAQ